MKSLIHFRCIKIELADRGNWQNTKAKTLVKLPFQSRRLFRKVGEIRSPERVTWKIPIMLKPVDVSFVLDFHETDSPESNSEICEDPIPLHFGKIIGEVRLLPSSGWFAQFTIP